MAAPCRSSGARIQGQSSRPRLQSGAPRAICRPVAWSASTLRRQRPDMLSGARVLEPHGPVRSAVAMWRPHVSGSARRLWLGTDYCSDRADKAPQLLVANRPLRPSWAVGALPRQSQGHGRTGTVQSAVVRTIPAWESAYDRAPSATAVARRGSPSILLSGTRAYIWR